jgi:hypothetical protein
VLADIAAAHGATPAEVALAWLLGLSPSVIAIPGARRPETARSAAAAGRLRLGARDRAVLARSLDQARPARLRPPQPESDDADVVLVMGIPGAGKTRVADEYAARGYIRLNRDERGGPLRALADALDEQLASGVRRVVLDNTYLDRAARSYVIEAAGRHGVSTRCIWLDTPLAQAQLNIVERLLERFGSLPTPDDLQAIARLEPGMLLPTSQMRALRELEPPSIDEGFGGVEQVPFARSPSSRPARAGVFVAAAALTRTGWQDVLAQGDADAPHLLFDWRPDGDPDELAADCVSIAAEVAGTVEVALCPHAAGPPRCWCRPPLPGLPLAFARAHGIDPAHSILVGVTPAHRTLATTIGARYASV